MFCEILLTPLRLWPVTRGPALGPTQYFYLFTQHFTLPTSRGVITASLSAAYWQKPFPNQLFRNRRNSPKSQQKAQTVITHATFGFNFLGCALPSIARHSSRHQAAAICLSEYQTPSRWWGRKYREYSVPALARPLNMQNCHILYFVQPFHYGACSIAGYWLGLKCVVIGENVFKYLKSTPKHGRYMDFYVS